MLKMTNIDYAFLHGCNNTGISKNRSVPTPFLEDLKSPVPGDKPIVKAMNKVVCAQPGSTGEIKFSAKATPEPVISWFFGEKQILPSGKYEVGVYSQKKS